MLSTPSYFKLKPQLRLAAEYHPSTCIEFELRCNSAASNLRYKTVFKSGMAMIIGHRVHEFTVRSTIGSRANARQNSTTTESQLPRATAAPRLPVTYRPSGVPLTPTEPDETTGAPPRRL